MSYGIIVIRENGQQDYYTNDDMTFGEWLETNIYIGAKIEDCVSIRVDK